MMKCLLQSYEATLREYRQEELNRVEAEKRATIEVIRSTNMKAKRRTEDPRYLVVDEWFQDEIFRINRSIEFKKESWWVRALSAVDYEGQSPLHYLATNDSVVAGDILKEMLHTGQGMHTDLPINQPISFIQLFVHILFCMLCGFVSTYVFIIGCLDVGRFHNKADRTHATVQHEHHPHHHSISEVLHSSPSMWFQSNAMYNTMTGHEIGSATENYHFKLPTMSGAFQTSITNVAEPKGRLKKSPCINSIEFVSSCKVFLSSSLP